MLESIITISVTGFLAGFIFAMPIAGPISIMITSNALNGRRRYSNLVSIGASLGDFTYIFIAVFGLTRLYSLYKPFIPYMFAAGSVFFIFLGYKIFKTNIDLDHLDGKSHLMNRFKNKEHGGFYTGLMINFLNPTLFLGGLTSSFFIISLVASLGFHTGGIELKLDQNVDIISSIEGKKIEKPAPISIERLNKFQIHKDKDQEEKPESFPKYFHLVISLCYALFLAAGTIAWFHLLAYLITKYRHRINVKVISGIIKCLGAVLCLIGLYFGYLAGKILL
jgi:threonine/homoserine/homoserine lactone efflux protein